MHYLYFNSTMPKPKEGCTHIIDHLLEVVQKYSRRQALKKTFTHLTRNGRWVSMEDNFNDNNQAYPTGR